MSKNNEIARQIRILLPGILITFWLVLTAVGAPYFGKIASLSSTDLATYLPKNAESSVVNAQLEKFQNKKALPLVIVYEKDGQRLSDADIGQINKVNTRFGAVNGVVGDIAFPVRSDDAKAAITVIPLANNGDFKSIFPTLKQQLADGKLSVTYKFTGPASFAHDLQNGFSGIDSTLLIVTVSIVFLILLAVYRSPILPFIVLGSSLAALSVAVFVVYYIASAGIVQMNGQVQGILFILVIGAATDYSLLYIARYREELTNNKTARKATLAALKSSFPAIVAAGGTVTIGLLCLLFSGLGSNRALGPVGSIGIALSVATTLTLLPFLLLIFGRVAFWPKKPHYIREKAESHFMKNHQVWTKIGAFVQLHPRQIWVTCTVVLLFACLGVTGLKADGVPQSSVVIGKSEARDGQKIVDAHFPSGSGAPAYIIADRDKQDVIIKTLDADKGVAAVSISVSGVDANAIPIGKADTALRDTIKAKLKPGLDMQLGIIKADLGRLTLGMSKELMDATEAAAVAKVPTLDRMVDLAYPFASAKVKTVDKKVLLQAVLSDPADSLVARDTIVRLRSEARKVDSSAIIGGTSAAQLDTNVASQHDLWLIVPLILLAITIILMLLLRSVVAPSVLLASTIISFAATLGVSAFVFNNVWHFAGADPTVIIMSFVFLVALGIDYNIFLMTRVREETVKSGISKGTVKGLVVTGGVITSAGIVLAATFASLSVIPILYLAEIAFIVTFGVLLDAIVVRSLLVPAITLEIGKIMWWPSRLLRTKK